jgi:drug/metabolite transporter (DMT)-like permease
VRAARNIAIIAVIAAAFAFLPGGGSTVNVILAILGMVFAVLIGLFGARLYREHRFTLDSLTDLQRIVLYSSIGLAALDFVAWQRLRDTGPGVLAFIALLAVASYGAFWVWMQSQKYG